MSDMQEKSNIKEYTSLELSKRLHEKELKGDYKNVWVSHPQVSDSKPFVLPLARVQDCVDDKLKIICPASTFTELWGVLPNRYWVDKNMYYWAIRTDQHQRCCIEVRHSHGALKQTFKSKSPAEAVGLLLEWLIDNKYMEVEVEGVVQMFAGIQEEKQCNKCVDLIPDGSEMTSGCTLFVAWYKCKHTGIRMSRITSPTKTIDGTDRPCERKDNE